MSNETANRSHAGLVVQMYTDPAFFPPPAGPPRVLAAWGFDVATLTRLASVPPGSPSGFYSIRLTNPASGLVGPLVTEFENIDSVIVLSSIAESPAVAVQALLLPDPLLPPVGVGQRVQLPLLAISVVSTSGIPFDGNAVLQLEVRRVPQQD